MSFKRLLLFLAFPALFTFVSCATFVSLDTSVAAGDLARLKMKSYPSFKGVGSLKLRGMGSSFAGLMALAIDAGKYRIEIYDAVGRTVFAGGGAPGKMIRIDPNTGEREELTGKRAEVAEFEGFRVPIASLKSIVYGAPPGFNAITSFEERNGKRIVKTTGPEMEIVYSSQVEKIRLIPPGEEEDEEVIIIVGRLAPGPIGPYAKVAHMDFGGGAFTLDIKWEKVRQGVKFSEGFFTFDEALE
ncbi:hypothetical protein MNBD_NITROSPINAE02-932 [hydrothermal vent metagenome]|uniref:DUF4292 domain-containing protein n=1 Tax=hydrothermal vent metagenome TaxID=652676 RepID=A0A3B1CLS4_9ZZZZ